MILSCVYPVTWKFCGGVGSTPLEEEELCFRNRFLLTVICCPIYHWLEDSPEVDISRAQSASDVFTAD